MEKFLRGETREIKVPRSERTVHYDPIRRIGIGVSRLGTSQAIAIGAYAFALRRLDEGPTLATATRPANAAQTVWPIHAT